AHGRTDRACAGIGRSRSPRQIGCVMVTHPTNRAARRRGFILVDVIVAGVLLGIGLVTVIGLTGSAIASQRRGEELQVAAMLADEQLNLALAVGPEAYAS